MLTKIIEFSVQNKLIIGLFVAVLILFGAYQTTLLPIDAVPDITNNQVQVITTAPSFGATDIERLITFPVEQATSSIPGIKEIRSFSRFGLSLVTIVFDDKADVYWARQQVAERLQGVQNQIPKGIGTPALGPVTTGLGEIYQYVIKPKRGFKNKFDLTELRTIQDWIVRRQLLGIKGIAEVSSFGGNLKQYEIAVQPNKLNAFGITIHDVFAAIEKNNENTGGAYIEKGGIVLYIRSEGLIKNTTDIENILIKTPQTSLLLKEVADIKIGYATRYGAMCYDDEGEVAGGVVMMLKGGNSSEVIKRVKEKIVQIQKTLPEGIEIEPFLDRTKMVNNAIGTVEKNLLEGALIVVFVLVIFLGNFRAGFLVASVIPLAMLFAICMMNAFGISGNLMSLGALDFGLIVDGAVIIVEAVMHHLSDKTHFKKTVYLSQKEMNDEVVQSSSKMMNSAVFGQLIILIVYLPIFTLEGIEGKMFKPMAQTVAFTLIGAFILSVTYIPMMSAFFLSKKVKTQKNSSDKIMASIENKYERSLIKVVRFPKIVLTIILILGLLSGGIVLNLGGEFIPALEEGDFAVDVRVLSGSNLKTTIENTQKAAYILKKRFPEIQKIVTKIGSGEVPTDPMPMEASDMMVILKDKSEWVSAKTFPELSEKMGKALEDVPGITAGFQYPVQMRFNELMTGARQDVVCKIFGENLDTLAKYAKKVGTLIYPIKNTQDVYIEPVTGLAQIIIEYNRLLLAQYQVSISEVNKVINTAFAGQSTGLIFEEEKRFDLVVRLASSTRKDIEDVQNLLIPTPSGIQIPLSKLATVQIKDGPNQIQREDAKRRIVVGFNVRGRDVQSIVQELQSKIETELKLPTGYFITYGGSFENLNQAKNRLLIAVPISLLLIFLLLYFAFNSLKQSLLIYTAIPLSAIGGIIFLALRGMPFSISASVGFIALFGVAVLNGIVLIAEFNRLKKSGITNICRVISKGTKTRLRPILMTAFVASLGFLPMAISNGAGAEVQRPLATVVIGGLLIATFLTLFVLPVLYLIFEKGLKIKPKISLVLLLFFSFSGIGQQKLTLDEAIAVALKNNRSLQTEHLKSEYSKIILETAYDFPKTFISGEIGQINSAFMDSKTGISQNISLPSVYKKQKKWLTEEWNATKLTLSTQEFEIKKTLTQLYYQILYLKEKQKLEQKTDSLYSIFLEKVSIRVNKGESSIIEKITAETQKSNTQIQIKQIKQHLNNALFDVQYLLNSPQKIEFILETNNSKLKLSIDSQLVIQNPKVIQLHHQKIVDQSKTEVEKSKLSPDFTFSYFNTSFIGTGADNMYYTANQRFNSVQIGVGIPIFVKAQKAKINALKVQETISENNYQNQIHTLQNVYQTYLSTYKTYQEIVNYYESRDLKNAELIKQTANQQFLKGEINYLDFIYLINQATTIQTNYLDALKILNDTAIQLNFLTSK